MSFKPKQIEMVCLEDLVLENQIYRKFLNLWDMDVVRAELEKLEFESDHEDYGIYHIFLRLAGLEAESSPTSFLQYFLFFADQLKSQGYMSEVFTFVDATHLISKVGLWKERDKTIELKLESLNNKTLEKVACDKDAKFWAKSTEKIWFTHKLFLFLKNELQTLFLLWLQKTCCRRHGEGGYIIDETKIIANFSQKTVANDNFKNIFRAPCTKLMNHHWNLWKESSSQQ